MGGGGCGRKALLSMTAANLAPLTTTRGQHPPAPSGLSTPAVDVDVPVPTLTIMPPPLPCSGGGSNHVRGIIVAIAIAIAQCWNIPAHHSC